MSEAQERRKCLCCNQWHTFAESGRLTAEQEVERLRAIGMGLIQTEAQKIPRICTWAPSGHHQRWCHDAGDILDLMEAARVLVEEPK